MWNTLDLIKCQIYHTGIFSMENGVIKEDRVYLIDENGELNLPKDMFLAVEECDNGLIQIVVDKKWGFANIYTGEIIIQPIWDYAGPFYGEYAHVVIGGEIEYLGVYHILVSGGKHGYINTAGEIVIPIIYDDGEDIPLRRQNCFKVALNGKWGVIDKDNNIIIPFE